MSSKIKNKKSRIKEEQTVARAESISNLDQTIRHNNIVKFYPQLLGEGGVQAAAHTEAGLAIL